LVVLFVVNNNRKQGIGAGGHFAQPQVGPSLAQRSHECWSRRSRVPGAAQNEAQRNGALQTRDRSSPWRSRISDAPLRHSASKTRVNALMAPRCIASGTQKPRTRAYPIHFSNSPSRSRGAFCARGLHRCFAHPNRGVGGAPRNVRVQRHPLGLHMTRQARRLRGALRPVARQDARERAYDAGRSPLGAPPWRFWAPGAALLSPALAPDRLQRAPRTQVVVPGGRGPCLPKRAVTEPPAAGRHASLRIQDRL
jgi:hypothetical protein